MAKLPDARITSLLLAVTVLVGGVRSFKNRGIAMTREELQRYYGCTPCYLIQCPPPPKGCEAIFPVGLCSCCRTDCASQEGEHCGLRGVRCGRGLKCSPPPWSNQRLAYMALLNGKGICKVKTRRTGRGKISGEGTSEKIIRELMY